MTVVNAASSSTGRLKPVPPDYRLSLIHFYAPYPGTVAPPAKTRAPIELIVRPRR